MSMDATPNPEPRVETLRHYLEALLDANHPMEGGGYTRAASYELAGAALAILDASPRVSALAFVHGQRSSDTAHVHDPCASITIAGSPVKPVNTEIHGFRVDLQPPEAKP